MRVSARRAVCGALIALASAAALAQTPQASDEPLPAGAGREVVKSTCGVCHDIDTAIGKRRTAADWQDIVNAMINRGAIGSEDDFKEIGRAHV